MTRALAHGQALAFAVATPAQMLLLALLVLRPSFGFTSNAASLVALIIFYFRNLTMHTPHWVWCWCFVSFD